MRYRTETICARVYVFLDNAASEQLRQRTRKTFPVRGVGTIEEIGQAAVFLMTKPDVTGSCRRWRARLDDLSCE
jgi:hypothetical protein